MNTACHHSNTSLSAPRPATYPDSPSLPPDITMFHPAIFLAQLLVGFSFLVGGRLAEGKVELGGLFSNTYLTFFCAGGACCGGAMYVIFNAATLKTQESTAARAAKFLASLMMGMCFTPWIVHKGGFSEDPSSVLMLSTLVGFIGWSIVLVALPTIITVGGKGAVDAFKRLFNISSETDPPK